MSTKRTGTTCNGVLRNPYDFTEKQKEIVRTILDSTSKLIFIDGPAGTSKTYLATYCGLKLLRYNPPQYESLLYIRNNVECSSKTFGILPGDMQEKFSPWSMPLEDKLNEMLPPSEITKMKGLKQIETLPINYLRGSSFRDKIIIVDEAQNMGRNEFVTTLTRIGENCKVIITGDNMQSDIKQSFFTNILEAFNDQTSFEHGIYQFQMTSEDIVRSPLVRYIVEKIEYATTYE